LGLERRSRTNPKPSPNQPAGLPARLRSNPARKRAGNGYEVTGNPAGYFLKSQTLIPNVPYIVCAPKEQ